jgi:uncharacterized protein YcaQ
MSVLTVSKSTQRRFLLGKQGVYPGRRWRGKAGVEAALRAGVGVQVDPLNVVAHSQDIVLYGRVLDYRPALLQTLLYEDRTCFEAGGALNIHPIEDLPYHRVVMARKQEEPRRVPFVTAPADLVETVYQAIRERVPYDRTRLRPCGKSACRTNEGVVSLGQRGQPGLVSPLDRGRADDA